ncbi:hypothetical protein SAMN02745866_03470 [Alteromonadaceae bacterium Bs31]|nr:hypothetical protein SAMN02745866_03470 [Alteromonadaceae bacterium Bs31]
MPKVLIFTLAAAGYDWLYKKNIQSHKAYIAKHAYSYSVVNRPRLTTLGLELVWLKIYLMREALKSNYDWLVCLDADTEIRPSCPAIESLEKQGKSIYLAKGYSDRINSGVLILRNDNNSRAFINNIIQNQLKPLAPEDDVGWGENGHVIHFAKNNPYVEIIDKRWNNNSDCEMKDFIRHYSAGPMRAKHTPPLVGKSAWLMLHLLMAIFNRIPGLRDNKEEIRSSLEKLTTETLKYHRNLLTPLHY